ncbi:MAG: hypothetical protein HKK67_03880 [Chlorobiaceae bacterium]|nr:hypothetical protein [Chlorobiaceae bacterium]
MDKTAALQRLKAIPAPRLIDGGYWKYGHLFFIVTEVGLITIDFKVYDPILGPIEFSDEEYAEIKEIAEESGNIAENVDLDPDEQLFLFNDGQPGIPYWAFQPYDDASLDEYTFSSDKALIEQKFLEKFIDDEIEAWEDMDEATLIKWAEKIA